MSSTVARISAEIDLKDRLTKPLKDAGTNVKKFADKADADLKRFSESAAKSWKSFGEHMGVAAKKAQVAGLALSVGVTAPLAAMAAKAVKSASDLNESFTKTEQVFGKASASVVAFSEASGNAMGLSKQAALDYASSFGLILEAGGKTEEQSARMSLVLSKLSADLASFYNVDVSEAALKIKSGLVGEAEPLRAFGVLLSETAVKARALAMGFTLQAGQLSEAAKVQARYAIILDQTKKAQGDFARTSDGLANSSRIVKANLADLSAELGTVLLPYAQGAVKWISSLVEKFKALSPAQKTLAVSMLAIAAVTGPVLVALGAIGNMVSAYAAMTTASAAAGVASIGLKATLIGFLVPLAEIIAVGAAVALVIYGLKKAFDYLTGASENAAGAIQDEINASTASIRAKAENTQKTAELSREYEILLNKKKRTATETERLNKLFSEIAATNPDLVKGYNAQGEAIHGLTKSYYDLANAASTAAEEQRKSLLTATFTPKLDSILTALSDARAKRDDIVANGVPVTTGQRPDTYGVAVRLAKSGAEYNQALGQATTTLRDLETQAAAVREQIKSASRASKLLGPIGDGSGGVSSTGSGNKHGGKNLEDVAPLNPFDADPTLRDRMEAMKKLIEDTAQATRDLVIARMKASGAAIGDLISMERFGKLYSELTTDEEKAFVHRTRDLQVFQTEQEALSKATEENVQRLQAAQRAREELNKSVFASASAYKAEREQLYFTTELDKARWEITSGGLREATNLSKAFYLTQAALLDQSRQAKDAVARWAAYWSKIVTDNKEWIKSQRATANERYQDYIKELTKDLLKLSGAQNKVLTSELFDQFKGAGAGMPGLQGALQVMKMVKKVMDDIKRNKDIEEKLAVIQKIARGIEDIFNKALNDLLENGFKNFFQSVLDGFRNLAREMAIQFLKMQLMRALLWGVGALFGSGARADMRNGIPGLATGGQAFAGQPYLVGERGPELFVPDVAGQVHRNDEGASRNAKTDSSTHVVINMSVPNYSAFRKSETQMIAQVFGRAARAQARQGR
jgi:hypothetical protein